MSVRSWRLAAAELGLLTVACVHMPAAWGGVGPAPVGSAEAAPSAAPSVVPLAPPTAQAGTPPAPAAGGDSSGKAAGATDKTPAKAAELEQAAERFQHFDFPEAYNLLKTATQKDDSLSAPALILAGWFAQSKHPADARLWMERAVLDDPSDPEPYLVLAEAAVSEGRITEAELALDNANALLASYDKSSVRRATFNKRVLAGLAAVNEAREKWPVAQRHLEAWLRLDPKNSSIHQRLAHSLFQQKKSPQALEVLRTAAVVDKDLLTPEAILARFAESNGDREAARHWMGLALLAAPKDFRTLLAAAQWAADAGEYQEAQKHIAAALQLSPDSPDAHFVQGVIGLGLKDYASAERAFRTVLEHSPANFAASNNLALTLCESEDAPKKQQALEYATVNVRQYPRQAETFSTLGWVYYKLGRLDEAQQALSVAASAGVLPPETAYYLARVAVDRDHKADARPLLEAALKVKGPFPRRRDAVALLNQLPEQNATAAQRP